VDSLAQRTSAFQTILEVTTDDRDVERANRPLSLYRLLACGVARVLAEPGEYTGLGLVDYELLAHLNRLDQPFLDKMARYSAGVPRDVVALENGSAVICTDRQEFRCIGRAARFRGGVRSPIEAAA
jgi:hypothetical protein